MSSSPTDMRNGRDGLAGIVREVMGHNPKSYDEAFIFYSKDYRKVKILHYDLNGYVMYQKWFDDGRFLRPEFIKMQNNLLAATEFLQGKIRVCEILIVSLRHEWCEVRLRLCNEQSYCIWLALTLSA